MTSSYSNSNHSRAKAAALTLDPSTEQALPYLETSIPVGLAGAAAVAAIVFALDVAAGQPLATPNALGATIFRGMPFDLATPVEAIHVFSYTLLHSALFIVAATAAVTAEFTLSKEGISLDAQLLMGTVALFAALQASILSLLLLLEIPVDSDLASGRLVAINAVAAMAMATVVYHRASNRLGKEGVDW